MDPMVSARVPQEIRDQANSILAEVGSSPTELINSAYRYLVETGSLPAAKAKLAKGPRYFGENDRRKFEESLRKTTRAVPEDFFAGRSYDGILEEELRSAYEALA